MATSSRIVLMSIVSANRPEKDTWKFCNVNEKIKLSSGDIKIYKFPVFTELQYLQISKKQIENNEA